MNEVSRRTLLAALCALPASRAFALAPEQRPIADIALGVLSPAAPLPTVDVLLDDTGPFRAVIDTGNGSAAVAVAETVAKRLGWVVSAQANAASGGVGAQKLVTNLATARSLAIGRWRSEHQNVTVTPAFDRLSELVGARFDVNLGYQLLRAYCVELDFTAQRFRLLPAAPNDGPAIAMVIAPLKPLILSTAQAGEARLQVVFDTGASYNLISPQAAARLALAPGAETTVAGVAGPASGKEATIARLDWGAAMRQDVPVVITEAVEQIATLAGAPVDAVLGAVDMQLTLARIDYPANRLHVR